MEQYPRNRRSYLWRVYGTQHDRCNHPSLLLQWPRPQIRLRHDTACKIMAAQHVMGVAGFATGFSSWTPSLSFVLKFADNLSRQNRDGSANHVHISVIDTKELWTSIQIFHVPALATALATGLGPYPEEYLAYGVIKGRWHKAVPLMVFREAGLPLQPALTVPPKDVCGPVETERASAIAKEFGPDFALPVYLAVLTKAGPVLGLDHVNFERLLSAIQPVDVPVKKWAKDTGVKPYMHHIDVVQFCRLMQTLAQKLNDNNASGNASNPRGENILPNKKRARVDEPATNKRVRIEVSANDQEPQLTTTFKTLAFDDDDDMDDDFSESDSEPEPALKKTRYTATSTTAAPAPKKPLKPILKKSTKTYGVTTRRMGKEGKALFKGPGVSTRRASRVMEREMKKLSIDMKD
ncbi:hypothetical protein BDY17DRAFT_187536 [Neohortaea acidophila]|uniref:DUF7587 domain-containing protein n=1 Tax=Neohortaea acidophila TaxID=245834 RepID=A0A6A6PMZ8_9PEZI|nr:uncharacterized protein BDY17DRAFT_187536 [Neohortaea acidophila]KAF2481372.1 hypothetical protein BDY17DRAFT_187536 [Neohortaea acidophila]